MKAQLSFAEKLMYYGACISTLGLWWIVKIVIKKAIIEANDVSKAK